MLGSYSFANETGFIVTQRSRSAQLGLLASRSRGLAMLGVDGGGGVLSGDLGT